MFILVMLAAAGDKCTRQALASTTLVKKMSHTWLKLDNTSERCHIVYKPMQLIVNILCQTASDDKNKLPKSSTHFRTGVRGQRKLPPTTRNSVDCSIGF